jgi:uncharacterized protein YraI
MKAFLSLVALMLVGLQLDVASASGTVIVASGNTLNVRSTPYSSGSIVATLSNGSTVTLVCYETGQSISGSQGTSSRWFQIGGTSGYAAAAYISTSTNVAACGGTENTGTVAVAAGNNLNVRSTPYSSGSIVATLSNGSTVTLVCYEMGQSISGSQGTSSRWFQIGGTSGYAAAAYISTSASIAACGGGSPTPSPPSGNGTLAMALAYGRNAIGTRYTGCAGGEYRFGKTAPHALYHDGTTCGQSRVYYQPAGSKGYDCSGLMVEMFRAGGINLPYWSSSTIKAYVPQVSKSSIRPGDMLAKNGHVVMVSGSGTIIESTPYAANSDGSWAGTREHSSYSYEISSDYTAHRYPGLY